MAPLAALVSKADAETAIDALRNAGVYDDERSIAEYDAEHLAIPVNAEPTDVSIEGLVEQDDPAFGDCERREAVGNALLDLHGEADTVLARHGIAGETREPDVEVVAGAGQTETIHYEHGTAYALDLSRVMFAPGNKAERARMGEVVESGETVLDMFAGVGYFALPMARAGARVTAIEKNPEAFRLLAENAELNDVRDRVELLLGDCRDVVETRVEAADPRFDRIVMGYYDAYEYLDSALDALAPDGVLHMHEATPEAELWERPERRLRRAAEAVDRAVELVGRRRVKSHSEGVWHVVLDARVAGAD